MDINLAAMEQYFQVTAATDDTAVDPRMSRWNGPVMGGVALPPQQTMMEDTYFGAFQTLPSGQQPYGGLQQALPTTMAPQGWHPGVG